MVGTTLVCRGEAWIEMGKGRKEGIPSGCLGFPAAWTLMAICQMIISGKPDLRRGVA